MQASNTDMSVRWLIALCLTACGVAAAAEPAGSDIPAVGPASRVLRAGDSILNIEVVDPPSAARSEELQVWATEAAGAALAAFGRFPLPTATVRIEQRDSRDSSPVPWGQTLRRDGVSVLLFPGPTPICRNCGGIGRRCTKSRTCSIPTWAARGAGWPRAWRATTRTCCARASG